MSAIGLGNLKFVGNQVSKKSSFLGAKYKFVLDALGKTESSKDATKTNHND
ncbi:hypothetical protein [Psychroserpens damuponensis]|uniref:hypothetical protein n=1 Tax=Psychroserpens damuponensis TaxID=943936 RepID=UPI000AECDFE7|nr:hypothetical protein [Psychroserpens damuponensis]